MCFKKREALYKKKKKKRKGKHQNLPQFRVLTVSTGMSSKEYTRAITQEN